MYEIIEKEELCPNTHFIKILAPDVAKKIKPGQFVIIRIDEKGERIPLTYADRDEKTVSIIFIEVGKTTSKLARLKAGDYILNFVGPLGKPIEIENFGNVCLIGGCYGIGGIYPIAKKLKEKGNRVISILEGRDKIFIYWTEKLKSVSDEIFIVTRNGSLGYMGHTAEFLEKFIKNKEINRIIIIGCTSLMKICSDVTKKFNIKTIVSLDSIMVDGTGMCGACRVSIGGQTKFVCVDGPHFDAHQVDWELLLKRKAIYLKEEFISLQKWECEIYP